jgi:hypothetical protein
MNKLTKIDLIEINVKKYKHFTKSELKKMTKAQLESLALIDNHKKHGKK